MVASSARGQNSPRMACARLPFPRPRRPGLGNDLADPPAQPIRRRRSSTRSAASRRNTSRPTAKPGMGFWPPARPENTGSAGSDYVDRATTGINAILRLADAIGNAADQEAASEAARSTSNLIINCAILLASIGLVLVSFWVAFSRILRPLSALTGAMGELANGTFLGCAVPGSTARTRSARWRRRSRLSRSSSPERARQEQQEKRPTPRPGRRAASARPPCTSSPTSSKRGRQHRRHGVVGLDASWKPPPAR